ncbi:hypothetical protein [Pedobacter sp. SYSU D00535]|uniref:hypothetical protein n=1 Tax=Pedobacter sp. SYSU D00535 TaxID=2810308 RepID=UPI001A95826B|nr:hypothetical protein [Pedobacter sp. SYSU D00535]
MDLKVIHIDEEQETPEVVEGAKLPLHQDPEYLANLKLSFIAHHNEKIRNQKKKALASNKSLPIISAAR